MNREEKFILPEDITKGEIIIIVIAFVIWTFLGVVFNNMIKDHTLKRNEKYYKAVQIDNDESLFEYAIRTDTGNALVHGEVSAVDTVTVPELTGEYLAVKVDTERYTKHTEKIEKKDKNGKVTGYKTKTSYEWDYYCSETSTSEKVKFLGVEFPYSKFDLGCFERLDLKNVSADYSQKVNLGCLYERSPYFESEGDLRYSYYVIPKTKELTIFAGLKDKSIYDVKVHYKSIPEVMEGIEKSKNVPNIVFTIIWYIAFAGGAFYFAMQRNRWLDL